MTTNVIDGARLKSHAAAPVKRPPATASDTDATVKHQGRRNMSAPILEVRDLHVSYGKVEALHGASLKVGAGQIVTVIGANGAGKSTMLNAVAGALPTSGSMRGAVLLEGEDTSGVSIEARVARGMCLVPESRELFTTMSVEDNLQLGSYRRYRAGEKNYADQLDVVYELFPRLKERRKQAAGTMSGGERQMLAIGRALMAKPRLLMLDEPSLGLAPLIVKEIFRIIVRLKETGVGILLIEQNARAALQSADYAYVLETGDVTLEGPAAQLADDPQVIETYLGLTKKKA
jgi:branched-chain amino acid transport system ATP-binding protein